MFFHASKLVADFDIEPQVHVFEVDQGIYNQRLEQSLESGTAPDIPIFPGDIIVVPEKKVDLGL